MFYRKRMESQIAELNGRVDALEDAVKRLTHDCTEMSKNVDALWKLYKEKMFAKPEQEQKPKPKKRRPKKNGKESPDSAK